jgi:molybdopterin-containing oxidoreductase family iron-sulfur binding subunit
VAEQAGVSVDKIRALAHAFARAHPSLALADGKTSNGTETCLAVNLLNYVVGNVGQTIHFGPTAAAAQISTYIEMRKLVETMEAGKVSVLLLAGVNPVFTLPEGERFRKALEKVPLVVSFASFPDETADAAHLILPDHTFLESWGDYEPWEGVRGLQQPAMRPLYETRALGDVLIAVAKRVGLEQRFQWEDFYGYLRDQWTPNAQGARGFRDLLGWGAPARWPLPNSPLSVCSTEQGRTPAPIRIPHLCRRG